MLHQYCIYDALGSASTTPPDYRLARWLLQVGRHASSWTCCCCRKLILPA